MTERKKVRASGLRRGVKRAELRVSHETRSSYLRCGKKATYNRKKREERLKKAQRSTTKQKIRRR